MTANNYSAIPGYQEARDKEQANRDLAFLNLPIPLCGIIVNQFCLNHLVLLGNCGNRFVNGEGHPQPEDVAQFLWIVSPDYSTDGKERTGFVKKLGKLKYLQSVTDIREYIEMAFQDSPRGGTPDRQYTADCAWLVEVMAHEYGWDDNAIMRKPVARLFQYLRLIQRRADPKAILFNPSDSVISQHLRASLAQRGGN